MPKGPPKTSYKVFESGGIPDLPLIHSTLSPNSHFWDSSVRLHSWVGLEGERDPGRVGLGRVNDAKRFSGLSPVSSPTRDNPMGSQYPCVPATTCPWLLQGNRRAERQRELRRGGIQLMTKQMTPARKTSVCPRVSMELARNTSQSDSPKTHL